MSTKMFRCRRSIRCLFQLLLISIWPYVMKAAKSRRSIVVGDQPCLHLYLRKRDSRKPRILTPCGLPRINRLLNHLSQSSNRRHVNLRRRRPDAQILKPRHGNEPRTVAILKSGVVDGMGYTLYVDGSIEAELPQGTLRFASINELRDHLENNA